MIRLLIFDLDGTLIDSAPDIVRSVNGLLESRSLPHLPEPMIKAAIGEGLKALVYKLFPTHHENPDFLRELERDMLFYYEKHILDTTAPYPGVREFLNHCEQKIAIVTNKQSNFTEKTLRGLGLDSYPWIRVFSGDSLSERKPHPLPLFEVMKAAGVEPRETLMIGDGIPDMKAAKGAGVAAIACEFGYTDLPTLMDLGAAASIKGFCDLPGLIETWNQRG